MASKQPETRLSEAAQAALRTLDHLVVVKYHGSVESIAGTPDLLGSWRGRSFAIELKQSGEKPSTVQRIRLKQWAAAGALVGIATTVDEVLRILNGEPIGHDLIWTTDEEIKL